MKAAENMDFISQGSTNNALCFLGPHRRFDPFTKSFMCAAGPSNRGALAGRSTDRLHRPCAGRSSPDRDTLAQMPSLETQGGVGGRACRSRRLAIRWNAPRAPTTGLCPLLLTRPLFFASGRTRACAARADGLHAALVETRPRRRRSSSRRCTPSQGSRACAGARIPSQPVGNQQICACVCVRQGIPISNNPFWRRVKARSSKPPLTSSNGHSLLSFRPA